MSATPLHAQPKPAQKPAAKPTAEQKAAQRTALEKLADDANDALEKKEFERAVELLTKFIEARPEFAPAHLQLAYAFTHLGKKDDARRELERVIVLDSSSVAAYVNLGLLLIESDPKAAIAPLRKAVELEPLSYGYRALLATAFETSGRSEEAVEQYRQVLRLKPDDVDTRVRLARLLLAARQTAEAEKEFRAVLERKAGEPSALLGLAECLAQAARWQEAAPVLADYLQQNPGDHANRAQYVNILLELKRYEDALAEMDRLEKAGFATAQTAVLRVDALVALKKFDEAAAAQQKIVAQQPKSAEPRARLGRLLLQKRDFTGAERELTAALQIDPNQTEALRDLAAAFYFSEQYGKALAAQDLLARRETPGAGFWFIRALCFDKLMHKPEALAAYQKFLEMDDGKDYDRNWQARQRVKIIESELKRRR